MHYFLHAAFKLAYNVNETGATNKLPLAFGR